MTRRALILLASLWLALAPAFAAPPAAVAPMAPSLDASGQIGNSFDYVLRGQLPPVATPYTGAVATGTMIATSTNAGSAQFMARSAHWARDTITALRVILPCWYANAGASGEETAIGAATTWTASIEYPAGSFTQIKWSGSSTGTCTDGTNFVSDLVTLSTPIPNGQMFWAREHFANSAAIIYNAQGVDTNNGAAYAFAFGSSVPDQTMGGTVVNTLSNSSPSSGDMFAPLAIVATTNTRTFCLVGDSRVGGFNDIHGDNSTDIGNLAHSIGPLAGYINMGLNGDQTAYFIASHANRVALGAYCSDVIDEEGINDAAFGAAAATIEANLETIAGYYKAFPNVLRQYVTTQEPYSTANGASITSMTHNGLGSLTAVVSNTAPLFVGETVTISGASPSPNNGNCTIVSITANTNFSCMNPLATTGGTISGTITYTDGFQSWLNQTTQTNNAIRVAVNDWKRTSLPAAYFYRSLELADCVEAGRDSGTWDIAMLRGASLFFPSLTYDGIHLSPRGHSVIRACGAISPATLY